MAKRKSIHIKGMEHGAPIPNGAVIGNLIFSSAISGKDAKTGVMSPDPDEQAEAMFRNLRLFMETRRRHARQYRLHEGVLERRKTSRLGQQSMAQDVSRRARPAGAPCARKSNCAVKCLFQIEVIAVL